MEPDGSERSGLWEEPLSDKTLLNGHSSSASCGLYFTPESSHHRALRLISYSFQVFYNLKFFWLRWAFVASHGLSLFSASGGYSLSAAHRLLIAVASHKSKGSRAHAMGVALWHVESSQTRTQTRVSYIGRQIPNHWTTREVPGEVLLNADPSHSSLCYKLNSVC